MSKTNKRTSPILVVFIFAVICVLLTALVVFLLGYRYTSTDEGIKFFGKYQNGLPYSGTVYYPNGLRAELDYESSTITYNNGDIYEGEITGILRNGNGKMTYYSTGESYSGPFVNKLTVKLILLLDNLQNRLFIDVDDEKLENTVLKYVF